MRIIDGRERERRVYEYVFRFHAFSAHHFIFIFFKEEMKDRHDVLEWLFSGLTRSR